METTLTSIEPIPVEYILGIAQTKATAAQRRPYIELVERWGEDDMFLPHLHQISFIRLCIRVDGFHRFALACFSRHGDCGSGGRG